MGNQHDRHSKLVTDETSETSREVELKKQLLEIKRKAALYQKPSYPSEIKPEATPQNPILEREVSKYQREYFARKQTFIHVPNHCDFLVTIEVTRETSFFSRLQECSSSASSSSNQAKQGAIKLYITILHTDSGKQREFLIHHRHDPNCDHDQDFERGLQVRFVDKEKAKDKKTKENKDCLIFCVHANPHANANANAHLQPQDQEHMQMHKQVHKVQTHAQRHAQMHTDLPAGELWFRVQSDLKKLIATWPRQESEMQVRLGNRTDCGFTYRDVSVVLQRIGWRVDEGKLFRKRTRRTRSFLPGSATQSQDIIWIYKCTHNHHDHHDEEEDKKGFPRDLSHYLTNELQSREKTSKDMVIDNKTKSKGIQIRHDLDSMIHSYFFIVDPKSRMLGVVTRDMKQHIRITPLSRLEELQKSTIKSSKSSKSSKK